LMGIVLYLPTKNVELPYILGLLQKRWNTPGICNVPRPKGKITALYHEKRRKALQVFLPGSVHDQPEASFLKK
jgi:hypothetical protein